VVYTSSVVDYGVKQSSTFKPDTQVKLLNESLNSDGQQFHQYQQLPLATLKPDKQIKLLKESLNSDGQHFHHYRQNQQYLSPQTSVHKKGHKIYIDNAMQFAVMKK
jgi:hypothetical protein